jgi:hypothetical protein
MGYMPVPSVGIPHPDSFDHWERVYFSAQITITKLPSKLLLIRLRLDLEVSVKLLPPEIYRWI